MRSTLLLRRLVIAGAILALPVVGYAQEATIGGTVTDSTGGVLPGVTITVTHEATGNTFLAVTDERGAFRLPVRTGTFRITMELSGFETLNRTVELLLGQNAVVNLQMSVAALAVQVTVRGEAPLIDTTSSSVSANIDPRQMQELPVQGRNWMDLSMLAPGARRNDSGGFVQQRQGYSQTVLDGQEVTVQYHSAVLGVLDTEQVGFSRDAIAEFEVIANQFDASRGHSAGMVVNAITKSGTNTFAGTVSSYFRDDKFKTKDFVAGRVLPYSNQQVSVTSGGPIRRDRAHFFGSYEYEREPKTFVYTTPYPSFNIDVEHPDRVHKLLGRLDYQFTPRTRLSVRGSGYNQWFAVGGGSTEHPAGIDLRGRLASQYFGTFTQVVSNRSVNEIRGGRNAYERRDGPQKGIGVGWKGGLLPYRPVLEGGTVQVLLRGFTIGDASVLNIFQDTWTVRDDFTTAYDWGGRHDVKLGGEYMWFNNEFRWCLRCMGVIDARGGPVPANLEALFPVWNDASTWNLAPLAPITTKVFHSLSDTKFGGEHRYAIVRHVFGGWVQDDWKVADRLTLNLGVRYDFDTNGHSEKLRFLPWLPGDLPRDKNNVAPRLGVNYQLTDRTALRGGYGLFFAFAPNDAVQQSMGYTVRFENEIVNDGRPDFVPNWFGPGPSPEGQWGGPKPTFEQSLTRACDQNHSAPGCVYRSLLQEIAYPGRQTSYSHQASGGLQQQLGQDMSVEVNYVYTGGRLEESEAGQRNVNVTWNPATGANYPFSDVSRRPFPDWGAVRFELLEGWSNYHAVDFVFTKRFSRRWQANGSYTLSGFRDADPCRDQWFIGDGGVVARRPTGFPLAPDLTCEYTLAETDQRHRANINGIWDIGYGIQLSGLYFFGSGQRRDTSTGQDLRGVGAGDSGRLRADGTIMPRNNLVGDPIHRVDLRLQKRLSLGGRRTIDGIVEVFNLFNHANYGSYVTNESSSLYGQPAFNSNVAYQPRTLQLGFRTAF